MKRNGKPFTNVFTYLFGILWARTQCVADSVVVWLLFWFSLLFLIFENLLL